MKRSAHPPEFTARAVAVGMVWAFTPLVGIQMYCVLMTWLAMRWHKGLDFNPVMAFAWTWISNVVTMIPMYYVFYLTGQVMLGRWSDLTGYDAFVEIWQEVINAEGTLWDTTVTLVSMIAEEQGLAMAVGCLPYAAFFGWFGYVYALKVIRRRRARRLEARLKRSHSRHEREQKAHDEAVKKKKPEVTPS